jgi:hypothetical protein
LYELAANEDRLAAEMLGESLQHGASNFFALAKRNPRIIGQWAKGQAFIPGLISQNSKMMKSNELLAEQLRVGERHPLPVVSGRGQGFDLVTPANKWASRLWQFINKERMTLLPLRKHGVTLSFEEARIADLKDFGRDTWDTWMEVAWDIVLAYTDNEPETNPELKELARSDQKRKTYKGTETVSYARNRIRDRLRQAFKHIAKV